MAFARITMGLPFRFQGARPAFAFSLAMASGAAAAAPMPAGDLTCIVDAGLGVGVGAFRNVACTYRRQGRPVERYEGYTGIITAPPGQAQEAAFQVYSVTPNAIADLGGDYEGRGFGSAGSAVLAGGRSGVVVLEPTANPASVQLAELNIVLGVSQLHLNFAGIDSHDVMRGRRRPSGDGPR